MAIGLDERTIMEPLFQAFFDHIAGLEAIDDN